MENMNFISSGSFKSFNDGDSFFAFAKEREKRAEWRPIEAAKLQFEPLFEEPLLAPSVATKYGANTEAIEECMDPEHSGLVAKIGNVFAPVGDSAIGTIRERMAVRKMFWVRQHKNPAVLAKDVNSSFSMMPGKCIVKVADEMVRAVLSERYTPINVPTVYTLVMDFLNEKYPEAVFVRGFYTHSYTEMLFDLSAYSDELLGSNKKVKANQATPVLYIQTSDVAVSSVSIRPLLLFNGTEAPLSYREDTRHLGKEELISERVQRSLELVMAKFSDVVEEVEKLDEIKLSNPYNALLRSFRAIKWPADAKKYALESAENFKAMTEGQKVTAYDAYMAIVDAFSFYMRDNPTADTSRFMDSVSRSVVIDWSRCDLPGTFSY